MAVSTCRSYVRIQPSHAAERIAQFGQGCPAALKQHILQEFILQDAVYILPAIAVSGRRSCR
jgi:hypothetical protein